MTIRVITVLLSLALASMLLGMMIRPSVQPAGEVRQQESTGWPAWRQLIMQSWRFLACVSLLQGAHAAYYGFSAIYWQSAGYSASAVGYLWSLGVVAEVIIFALSHKLFRRFSARDLLLLSAVCGVVRWGLMGWSTELPWLIVVQILHCGTFTVCHGGHALHCRTPEQRSDSFAGGLFRHCDGRQYCHHDRVRWLPVPEYGQRCILDYGAGGAARHRLAA